MTLNENGKVRQSTKVNINGLVWERDCETLIEAVRKEAEEADWEAEISGGNHMPSSLIL